VLTPSLPREDTAPPEAASEPAARTWLTWATRRPWLLAWLAFLPVAVLRAGELAEADTFWEIRTGLLTIQNMAIPATDPFSWTMHGKAWTLNSWAFNVVIAVAYRLAGLAGVAWACIGLVMVIVALVLTLARMLGASPAIAGIALFLGSPLLIGWLSARPQLTDYLAFMIIVMLLRRIAGAPPGQPRWWSVAGVGITCVIWVNLHAGALLGVAVAAACAVLLLVRRSTARAGMWCAAAAVAALAGTFVNPYGLGVIAQTTQVQAESSGVIAEWRHLDPASPIQDFSVLIGLLALVLVIRRRDAVLTAALAVTTAGSVIAIRSLPFVVLLALPVLAAWAAKPSPALASYARSRQVLFRRGRIAGVVAITAVASPSLAHIGRPELATYPVSIVKDIPAGCRLFNTDLLGGFVILERPDVPVSLDTRNTLYGKSMLFAEERVLAGKGNLTRGLAGAGCVLVPPASGLARRLDHDPGWKLTASEPPAAVLFIRR
jgi:hypothetical protein